MKKSELKSIIMECIDEVLNEDGESGKYRKEHGKIQDTGEDKLTKKVGSTGRNKFDKKLRRRTTSGPDPIIKTSHIPTSKENNRFSKLFNSTKNIGRFQMHNGDPRGKTSGDRFKGGDFSDYTWKEKRVKDRNK